MTEAYSRTPAKNGEQASIPPMKNNGMEKLKNYEMV
jgi:hypothetical protein